MYMYLHLQCNLASFLQQFSNMEKILQDVNVFCTIVILHGKTLQVFAPILIEIKVYLTIFIGIYMYTVHMYAENITCILLHIHVITAQ